MEDKRPAQRVYVTFDGREIEIVPTDKLTMPELKEAKAITKMPLADMEVAFAKGDPDAWEAMLYISLRRVEPTATLAQVSRMFGDTPLMAVIETLRDETPEVAATDPLASGTEKSASQSSESANGSGEKTLPLSTLETSGSQP